MVGTRWRLSCVVQKLFAAKAKGQIKDLLALEQQLHDTLSQEAQYAHLHFPTGSMVWDLFKLHRYLVDHQGQVIDLLIDHWHQPPTQCVQKSQQQQQPEDEVQEDCWASGVLLLLCSHRASCRQLVVRENGLLDHIVAFSRTAKQPERAKACLQQILVFALKGNDLDHRDAVAIRAVVLQHVEVVEILMARWTLYESLEFVIPLMMQLLRQDSHEEQETMHCAKCCLVSNPQLGSWLQEFFRSRDQIMARTQHTHSVLQIVQQLIQEPWSVLHVDHAPMVFQAIEHCASMNARDRIITSTCQTILAIWNRYQAKNPPKSLNPSPQQPHQTKTSPNSLPPSRDDSALPATVSLPVLVQRLAAGDLDSRRHSAKGLQQMLTQCHGIIPVVGGDMVKLGILNHLILFAQDSNSGIDHYLVEELLKSLARDPCVALAMVQQKPFIDDLIQLTMQADSTPMLQWIGVWRCLHCLSGHHSEEIASVLVESDALETLLSWSVAMQHKDSSFWSECCGILQNLCSCGDEQHRFQVVDKGGILLALDILDCNDPSIQLQALQVLHDLTLTSHEAVYHHLSNRLPKVRSFTLSRDDQVRVLAGKVLQRANSVMVDDATKLRHFLKMIEEGDSDEKMVAEECIYTMISTAKQFPERNTKLLIKEGGVPVLVSKWPDPFAVKTVCKLCETLSASAEFVNGRFLHDLLRFFRNDLERTAADGCIRHIVEHANDNTMVYRIITRVDVLEHMIREWPFETIYLRVLPMLRALLAQKDQQVKCQLSSSPRVADCLMTYLDWPLKKTRSSRIVVSALEAIASLVEDPWSMAHEPHAEAMLKSVNDLSLSFVHDPYVMKHCELVQRLFESFLDQDTAQQLKAPHEHQPSIDNTTADPPQDQPLSLSELIQQLDRGDFEWTRRSVQQLHQYCALSRENRLELVNAGALSALIAFAQATVSKEDQHLIAELISLLVGDPSAAKTIVLRANFLQSLIGLTHGADVTRFGWVWRCVALLSKYECHEIQHALLESGLVESLRSLSKHPRNQGLDKCSWQDGCDIVQNLIDHADEQARARLATRGARSFAFECLSHQDINIQQKGTRLLRVLAEVRLIETCEHGALQDASERRDTPGDECANKQPKETAHNTASPVAKGAEQGDNSMNIAEIGEEQQQQNTPNKQRCDTITVCGWTYQLQECIDENKHSKLFQARVLNKFNRRVLLKMYSSAQRSRARHENQMLRELMTMERGSQTSTDSTKYVVECLEFSEQKQLNEDPCAVLIMERGKQSLQQLVREADVRTDILPTMQKVAECLRFLHLEAQVVHGAIQLGNVMNVGGGFLKLKLMGFDGACHLNERMALHCNLESCPPELARQVVKHLDATNSKLMVDSSMEQLDGWVVAETSFDIWCFGVLWIKCLLRGKALVEFRGMNAIEMVRKIARPDFTFEQTLRNLPVSNATKVAIRQCVRRDPQLRWTVQDIVKSHVIRGFSTTLMNVNDLQAKLERMEETMQHMMEQHSQKILEAMESTLPTTWLLVPWRNQDHKDELSTVTRLWSLIRPEQDLELKMLCDAVLEEEGLRSKEPCSGCPEDQRIRIKAASPFVVKALPLLRCASALLKIANVMCLVMGLPAFSFVESFLTNVCGAGDLLEMMKQVLAIGFDQDAMVGMITENLDSMVDLAEKDLDDHVQQRKLMMQTLQEGSRQIRALCQSPEKQQLMRDLLNHVDPQKKWTEHRVVGGLQKVCASGTVRWLCAHHAEQMLNPTKRTNTKQPSGITTDHPTPYQASGRFVMDGSRAA